jgi:hypothetical protein
MVKNLPPDFDRIAILRGLYTAMEFGEPTRTSDKATFFTLVSEVAVERDDDGIPFDSTYRRTRVPRSMQVPVAIEFIDKADQSESFGYIQSTRVKLTLLDPDYQKVKGFNYVVIGGDKYNYRITEPPVALGAIDVWTVHVVAEDES